MGYEYELLSRFAKSAGLKLTPVEVRDSSTLLDRLNRGDGDVVAAQLIAPSNESEVLASDGLYETAPVVVQRGAPKPSAGHAPATTTVLGREAREPPAPAVVRGRPGVRPGVLGGHCVHTSRRSPYRQTLLELNDEL